MLIKAMDQAALCARIPHSGKMCLLDSVESWDQHQILCLAGSHLDPNNPLRNQHGLAMVYGLEYAAQAMAIHGSLLSQKGMARAGLLASVRAVEMFAAYLNVQASPLRIVAHRISGDQRGILYCFCLTVGDGEGNTNKILLQGRAAVLFPEPLA